MNVLQKPVRPATRGVPAGASLFLLLWVINMAKPFLSFDQQITKLQTDKNLTISDRAYALKVLQNVGYFALIGGYKKPFKDPSTNKYRNGTQFEDIVALFKFDESLREIFLKYILQIERHLRSLLSYYFTEKFGEQQIHYLTEANFCTNPTYQNQVKRLIEKLDDLANKNQEYVYINHQRKTYGNVPLWVLAAALSFGSLSKFYSLSTQDLQIKIAKNFSGVNEKQLDQFLAVITKFRNVCAHNERLFSYKTRQSISDMKVHQSLNIPKKKVQYIYGKHDLFAIVIAFRYLLSDEDFNECIKASSDVIIHYTKASQFISESTLLDMMGFPKNWKIITTCKK